MSVQLLYLVEWTSRDLISSRCASLQRFLYCAELLCYCHEGGLADNAQTIVMCQSGSELYPASYMKVRSLAQPCGSV